MLSLLRYATALVFGALTVCSGVKPAAGVLPSPADCVGALPELSRPLIEPMPHDYLVDPSFAVAQAYRNNRGDEIILDNRLVRRTWRISPNGACVAFDNLVSGQAMLRSVRPEARIVVDGVSFEVGGLTGQTNHAYLANETLDAMVANPKAYKLVGVEVGKPTERLPWARKRPSSPASVWPPRGVSVCFNYALPAEADARDLRIAVHYEMYDGLPAMAKWITVENLSSKPVTIDRFVVEELAVVEQANWVETGGGLPRPDSLHVETDFAFGGFNHEPANRHVVRWLHDSDYATQSNWELRTPCLLEVSPDIGPSQTIEPGGVFTSCRTFELAYDGTDRERRGLALRRFYRTIAPWVTENPLTHHLLSSDPEVVTRAVNEAAEVGFECVILSFGSGFEMENDDPAYRLKWREIAADAATKGVELGGYSLFSSRAIGEGNDIVSPPGHSPKHGSCPAATSPWGIRYFRTMRASLETCGFGVFENDGPYPGDVDVTPRPPYQKGALDSQWAQWKVVTEFYRWCRGKGVYVNAPDYYYLQGSSKCGMGYRETNWSLPRDQQVIHTRQNIFDGTWEKTPSMGWMFVPLAQYHGGGEAATVEPLHAHLDHYERMIDSNFAFGVQAHYRGPRLYDTPGVRDAVAKKVTWYKEHREILESDLIHGRRADGRDVDWVLHVNPQAKERGMLVAFNPLARRIRRTLSLDLHYTGVNDTALVLHEGKPAMAYQLKENRFLDLDIDIPAGQMKWYVFEQGPQH